MAEARVISLFASPRFQTYIFQTQSQTQVTLMIDSYSPFYLQIWTLTQYWMDFSVSTIVDTNLWYLYYTGIQVKCWVGIVIPTVFHPQLDILDSVLCV